MSRIVSLDFLRNFANISRCIIHASVPYMVSETPIWPVDNEGLLFFDILVFESHLFVMELFFMISGFIFAMQLSKGTIHEIVINRTKRIVIPFLLGVIILVPVVLSIFNLSQYPDYTFFQWGIIQNAYVSGWNLGLENFFPTGHLWYLYYLIIFYTLTILMRRVFAKIKTPSLNKIVLLGIVISSTCMFFMNRWVVDNPLTLIPELPSLLHYYFFFVVGIFVFESRGLLESIKNRFKYFLKVGFIVGILAIIPQYWFANHDFEYYELIKISAITLSSSSTHFIVLGLWGFFNSHSLNDSKRLRYLTDSSYWIYLTNMPLVVIFQLILLPIELNVFIKFIVVFLGALAMNLISYEFLVRYTFIGGILNKKRIRNHKG